MEHQKKIRARMDWLIRLDPGVGPALHNNRDLIPEVDAAAESVNSEAGSGASSSGSLSRSSPQAPGRPAGAGSRAATSGAQSSSRCADPTRSGVVAHCNVFCILDSYTTVFNFEK
uniref:Uncharacterized protein n=1 Tax=Arundo donax TaxID=35708 RepID=A0A0A9AH39_ARUDO